MVLKWGLTYPRIIWKTLADRKVKLLASVVIVPKGDGE